MPANVVTAGNGVRVRALPDDDTPLGGEVVAVPDAEGLRAEGAHGPMHVDAVLLDDRTAHSSWVHDIVEEAVTTDVPVIGYHERASAPSQADGAVRVGPSTTEGPWPRPAVDTARINPIGFRRATEPTVAITAFTPGTGFDATAERLDTAARAVGLRRVDVAGLGDDASTDARAAMMRRLRPLAGVLDHPELHADAAAHATFLVNVTAAGVPVVTDPLPAEVTRHLGDQLVRALTGADAGMLTDLDDRERLSVRQRSAALRDHGAHHAWRVIGDAVGISPTPQPTVSVLLATNRPEHLLHAAAQHEHQAYGPRELVAVLHGDGFPADAEQRLRDIVSTPVTVRRVPSTALLGEVMNLATEAAGGELVTKLDDDDLYDADHLDDLVEALRYSGATLVAKGSEFVYLQEIDLTIRRMPNGAETGSRSVAGGTLMMARDDLRRIGHWQRVPRFIDQLLIDDVLRAGGRLHRTHGHGFVLNRHDRGHTWESSVDRFLQHAVSQWPGLALDAAGFGDTTRTLP